MLGVWILVDNIILDIPFVTSKELIAILISLEYIDLVGLFDSINQMITTTHETEVVLKLY